MIEKSYYETLLKEKELGFLKPMKEFSRDELKVLVKDEYVTVKDLAELFDVSNGKITDLKRIKKLRDSDFLLEMELENYKHNAHWHITDCKDIMNDCFKEFVTEENNELLTALRNEIVNKLIKKSDSIAKAVDEEIKKKLYSSEKELQKN